jgi:enediyne biosynthesis protein E4
VKWPEPSGKTEKFTELPIDKYITIIEGEGLQKT